MLIPSIDLMGGRIVQLVQGERLHLAFDDFEYWIERFSKYPLVQLIDLDAAMRHGENGMLVEQICKRLPCQVGGGVSSLDRAEQLLAAGATRVIVGSALFRQPVANKGEVNEEFASRLAAHVGADRVVAGIDARGGQIAIKGWKAQVALTPEQAIPMLEPFVGAYLYTHIDGEGLMNGFPVGIAKDLRARTNGQLIVAGGICTHEEIAILEELGVDAVVGMAVYTNLLAV